MKCNFLYQITAASRTPDKGATAPRSPSSLLCPLLNLLNPRPPTKFLGTPLAFVFADTTIDQSVEGLSYGMDDGGVMVRFAEGSKRADQLWGPPNLAFVDVEFLTRVGDACGWSVKLNI